MIESLKDLSNSIKKQGGILNTFYGHNDSVVEECIKKLDINIVAFNLDITPYF
jgi:deoxyribodipyrimidine photolyase